MSDEISAVKIIQDTRSLLRADRDRNPAAIGVLHNVMDYILGIWPPNEFTSPTVTRYHVHNQDAWYAALGITEEDLYVDE